MKSPEPVLAKCQGTAHKLTSVYGNYAHKCILTGFVFETNLKDWAKKLWKENYLINEKGMY